MARESILAYLTYAGIALIIGFLAAWGIVEGWVLFWDYGWIYNEVTVPPLVVWDIFSSNILIICVLGSFLAGVIIFLFVGFFGD